jgi:hypothetical protein
MAVDKVDPVCAHEPGQLPDKERVNVAGNRQWDGGQSMSSGFPVKAALWRAGKPHSMFSLPEKSADIKCVEFQAAPGAGETGV